MPDRDRIDAAARRICREVCAFMGEPPCWSIGEQWPPPLCDDPGCIALARAALQEEGAE
jgi:hypothetical protein